MNFIPVFLICFVIFVLWMFYEQRKSQNKDKEASDAFWERERMANQTRKKDISHLPILHVEESELPVFTTENESVLYYIDHIRKIIKSPMLDLSEYSNTDLKLAYGVEISRFYANMMKILIIFPRIDQSGTCLHRSRSLFGGGADVFACLPLRLTKNDRLH